MTTTIVYGDSADGYLENFSASYVTALAGGGTYSIVDSAGTTARWGQKLSAGNYFLTQAQLSFTYSVPANETITAAYVRLYATSTVNTGQARSMEINEYDWGATVDSGDWRPNVTFGGLPHLAVIDTAQNAASLYMSAGSETLRNRLATGASPLRCVIQSDRQRNGQSPPADEESFFATADTSGTATDPALIFTSVRTQRLLTVLGAQVQLSDGTHAYIENNTVTTPSFVLKHRDSSGTVTTIATLPSSTFDDAVDFFHSQDAGYGAQKIALVVDASDNLYVIGAWGGNPTSAIVGRGYVKTSGSYAWTPNTIRSASLPTYTDAHLNNFAAAWHSAGDTIVVVASHAAGRAPNTSGDAVYALLSASYMRGFTLGDPVPVFLKASGAARGVLVSSAVGSSDYTNWANPTGTALDVVALPSTTNRGVVVCTAPLATALGDQDTPSVYRYILASDGKSFSDTDGGQLSVSQVNGHVVKDASAKVRVLPISSTQHAVVTADPTTGWGITVEIIQNTGTSSTFTLLGRVKLDAVVATIPAAATLATSQLWDAVYEAASNKIWIYYVSSANNRRLMRTSVNLSTYLAAADEVEITAALGAVGSTNYTMRVHRGPLNARQVLVCVSNVDSGGTHSTVYTVDTLNAAPSAPVLTPKSNFDATASATFAWTFVDANPGDTQSGFQIQINTSSGVYRYDSARVSASATTFVANGVEATGNNTSLSPTVPSGSAGDTLIGWASIRNSASGSVGPAPSGWLPLLAYGNVAMLGKVAEAASESAPTITFLGGSAGDDTLARLHRFRNLPLFVSASATQLNSSAQDIAYPGLTVPHANSTALVFGWKQDDFSGAATIAGFSEMEDFFSTSGNDAGQALDRQIQSASAAVASGSFTITGGASAISRGVTLSMGPAGHTASAASFVLPANTLYNAGSWQWRIRTWDSFGAVGPWSAFSVFSTGAGGIVTITQPSVDNAAGQVTDDAVIGWSVSGTVQDAYRIRVYRTSDNSQLSDTGYVTSSATSALISGMLSDVEYRVEVVARNAALVDSSPGTRLITPSYGNPEQPTMIVTVNNDGGYIEIGTSNPVPGSVTLQGSTLYDFEVSASAFTTVVGGTFARSSAAAASGTWSGLLTSSGTPAQAYARPGNAFSPTIVPGRRYTVSYDAYSIGGYSALNDAIDWYTASGSYLSTGSVAAAISSSTWTRRSSTFTAPASAGRAEYGPTLASNPASGTKLHIDNLLLTDSSDRPVPVINHIMRRELDGEYVVIGTCPVNGSYRDYAAGSGIEYTYKVRAVAP